MIENADELMANFAESFKDEPDIVQQQILISCMKLYLHRPNDGQEILKDIFKDEIFQLEASKIWKNI